MAWQSTAVATAVCIGVALLGSIVLTNWTVSPPAIAITSGIILFYQALGIIMHTPARLLLLQVPAGAAARCSAIAVFPLAIPALVTAPGIAAITGMVILNKHDLANEAIIIGILVGGDGPQLIDFVEHRRNPQVHLSRDIVSGRVGDGRASGHVGRPDCHPRPARTRGFALARFSGLMDGGGDEQ